MVNFKTKVLDFAIDQINEHTDIKASYEQHKEGRSITGFTFTFKEKSKPKVKPMKYREMKQQATYSALVD